MEKAIRWMFFAVLSVLLVYSAWSFCLVRTRLWEARSVLEELQLDAAALSRENEALSQGREQAGSEETLRQIAREQLGLVLPGDRIYIVGDEN